VYRRNTTARYAAAARRGDPADRSQTLPRGFGRSRSAMSGLQSTGGSAPPPGGDGSSTLPRGRHTTAGELKRQSALGLSASGGLGADVGDARPAKRTTSTVSMTSIGYRGVHAAPQSVHFQLGLFCDLYRAVYASTCKKCIAVRKVATPLQELTCHMGSHSVTCHPAEVAFPPLPQPKLVLD